MARHDQSFPRSRVRCRPPRRDRENPIGRKLVVRRGRVRDERRCGRPDQSACEGSTSPDGSAAARAAWLDRAIAQQGRGRGRTRGPRLQHELGSRFRDGESGDRRPPRGSRDRAPFRGGFRRGLGRAVHVRAGRLAARGPARPPGIVRAGRRRFCSVPTEIETGRQRHKTPPAGPNACPRPSCSPPQTWRSSATVH